VRVLVTGASGHIGSFVARRLLGEGHEVLAGARASSDLWRLADIAGSFTLVPFELATLAAEPRTIAALHPDVVVHAAWSGISASSRDDPRHVSANVGGTLELVRQAGEAGVRAFVGLGSQAEYGLHDEPLREDMTPRPVSLYGAAKLATAGLAGEICAAYGMRFAWLRLTAAYGPMDDRAHLLPSVIQDLLAARRPAVSPGTQEWDYLYVEDVAEAIATVVATEAASGILNLSAVHAWTVRALVEEVRDLIDPDLEVGFGERGGAAVSLRSDPSRLRELTGWAPRVALEDGLRATVDWEREYAR
jgi:nucleoside-diphosphate-sugar epimerase